MEEEEDDDDDLADMDESDDDEEERQRRVFDVPIRRRLMLACFSKPLLMEALG